MIGNIMDASVEEIQVTMTIKVQGHVGASATAKIKVEILKCFSDGVTNSYPDTSISPKKIQIRSNSWSLTPPIYSYKPLCNSFYDKKIEILDTSDQVISAMEGVTLDLSTYEFTIETEIGYLMNNFKIRYSESAKYDLAPNHLDQTYSETIEIQYVDNCGDSTLSSIQSFTVRDMQTSVLRTDTEISYPLEGFDLPDILQQIDDDVVVLLNHGDDEIWNDCICGDVGAFITHDEVLDEVVEFEYSYLANKSMRTI